jgi:hypothetical protein
VAGTPAIGKLQPAQIGENLGAWRRPSSGRRLPKRTTFIGVGVLVLLVLGGSVGYSRYTAYSADLRTATGLAASGKLGSAIIQYQSAINAWPLNSGARNGLANAQVAANARAQRAKSLAGAGITRHLMYKARRTTRGQLAARVDATAAAGSD